MKQLKKTEIKTKDRDLIIGQNTTNDCYRGRKHTEKKKNKKKNLSPRDCLSKRGTLLLLN